MTTTWVASALFPLDPRCERDALRREFPRPARCTTCGRERLRPSPWCMEPHGAELLPDDDTDDTEEVGA